MQHHQIATYMDEALRRLLLLFKASCLAILDTGSSGCCCSTALPDWAETLHEAAGARQVLGLGGGVKSPHMCLRVRIVTGSLPSADMVGVPSPAQGREQSPG